MIFRGGIVGWRRWIQAECPDTVRKKLVWQVVARDCISKILVYDTGDDRDIFAIILYYMHRKRFMLDQACRLQSVLVIVGARTDISYPMLMRH